MIPYHVWLLILTLIAWLRQYWLVLHSKAIVFSLFHTVFFKGCTYNQPTFEGMRSYILFPEGEGVYRKYVDLSSLVICLLSPTGVCGNGELQLMALYWIFGLWGDGYVHWLDGNNFIMYMCWVAQLYPPLCNSMDCSQLGSSVYGIFHTRILEWVAISYSIHNVYI